MLEAYRLQRYKIFPTRQNIFACLFKTISKSAIPPSKQLNYKAKYYDYAPYSSTFLIFYAHLPSDR